MRPKRNIYSIVDDLMYRFTGHSVYEYEPWEVWGTVALVVVVGLGIGWWIIA